MKKQTEGYVKMCSYGVLPPDHVFIEMEVELKEGEKKRIFTFTIKDPNWQQNSEGCLEYAEEKIDIQERDKYKMFDHFEEEGNRLRLTEIEKEMATDLIFSLCEEEMIAIRSEQEEKMMTLLGMSHEDFNNLTEEEMEKLDEAYERID